VKSNSKRERGIPASKQAQPVGLGRGLARYALRHVGLVTLLGVIAWGALGWWQWRTTTRELNQRPALEGKHTKPSKAVQLRFWIFLGGASGWMWLRQRAGSAFDAQARQRVLGGLAVRRELLWGAGALGALGIVMGMGLTCGIAESLAHAQVEASGGYGLAASALLVVLVTAMGGSTLLEVFRQGDWEWYAAGREKELADELLESEKESEEEEKESDRKTIRGWAYGVFLVGFAGGMLVMSRLPDNEGSCAFVSSVMATVWTGIAVQLRKERKPGWWRWPLVLAPMLALFVEYMRRQFEVPAWWAGAGLLWGGSFGWLIAVLYWRGLKRR
jgi:hypothetical protein